MTTVDILKGRLKTMVENYSKFIDSNKATLVDTDKSSNQKTCAQQEINRLQNILNHIKDNKIIIDLIDVKGRYYASADMLKTLGHFNQNDLHRVCSGQWDIMQNNPSIINSYVNDVIYLPIHGSIQKYIPTDGFRQYLSYKLESNLEEYYRQMFPGNNENQRYRISALDKIFEFNIIPYKNDFTTIQKNIETTNTHLISKLNTSTQELQNNMAAINTNLELRLGAITQEFQSKLEAMAQEMNKVSKTATDRIRDLEMEVHYLKSITESKVKIDYESIKQKNKTLNAEFKRIYKLYRR